MSDNKLELVVEVDVDRANASIKSVNAGLSNIESTAANAARGASRGIDGLTVSMAKGAVAGNLFADAIKSALTWAKDFTVGSVMMAAENAKVEASLKALARAHGVGADAATRQVAAIEDIGFEFTEAAHAVQRLIVADMDLAKSEGLAKLAKDAAAVQNVSAGEAMESIVLAIESGASRGLRTLGLFVDFQKEAQISELQLGRTLTETEEKQLRYNAVMREGAKIQGAHAAASQTVEGQLGALRREFNNLREDIGAKFQDDLKSLVGNLRGLVGWLRENTDLLTKFGEVALWVSGVLASYALAEKIMALAKSIAALNLASLNPYALLATGVVAAGAIVYTNWKKTQEQMQARADDMKKAAMREDLLSGKTSVEALRKQGMTDDQLREMISGRRPAAGGGFDFGGSTLSIQTGAGPNLEALKQAAEIRKRQADVERESRQAANNAAARGQLGFAREMAEMNSQIQKWTTFVDDKGVEHKISLTRQAWQNVLTELSNRWSAFREKFQKENREQLAEYLKGEEEASKRRMEIEAAVVQRRLQYNEEISRRNLDHLERLQSVEEQRAGISRDAQLRSLDAIDAQTLSQKVWVEQQKAQIEVDYLGRVHEIKTRLFDLETSRMVLEEEANMNRLGYRADEIKARIAELTQQRDEIRQANQEATDTAVGAARQNAANRTAAMVRDHNRQIFDSFKRQAEGVFDALLSKSQSVWSAIGNSLKTALLTAIKDVVTSRVAAMLTQMFAGARVSLPSSGTSNSGMLGRLGGLLGIGAAPVFGGTGIGTGGFPGSTPPFIPSPSGGRGAGLLGIGSTGALAGLKDFLGFGGGVQFAPGMATTWQAATMGQKLSALGRSNAALLGGGMLAMDGLRRGGWTGLAETTAGGALIGFKFGGPVGAAIGATVGAAAGFVRMFIKGSDQKAIDKIRDIYKVTVDKSFARSVVEMAKSGFGGNLEAAIRSSQVRDMVMEYAIATGQSAGIADNKPRGVWLTQQGGSLYQSGWSLNGQQYGYASSLPSLGNLNVAQPQAPTYRLDTNATKAFWKSVVEEGIADAPRAVQAASNAATNQSYGRTAAAGNLIDPMAVTI